MSDSFNMTLNWVGPDVCSYTGMFCTLLPSHPVALNHGDIARYLPEELGLLCDLALFHINSNWFCSTFPRSFDWLKLLYKLDVDNNRFAGRFPDVVFCLRL